MLRRVEVLAIRFSMVGRMAFAGWVICAAVFAAGWRSPFVEVAVAQSPDDTLPHPMVIQTTPVSSINLQSKAEPLSLAYVPRDSATVWAARPATLLAQPVFESIRKAVDEQQGMQDLFGVDVRNLRQVTVVFLPEERPGMADDPALIVHFSEQLNQQELLEKWLGRWEDKNLGELKYYQSRKQKSCAFPDSRTAIFAQKPGDVIRILAAGEKGAVNANWITAWERVSDSQAAAMIDLSRMRAGINQEFRRSQFAGSFSPIWNDGNRLVIGVNSAETLALNMFLECETEKADQVKDTIKAALVLGRNGLSALRAEVARKGGEEALMFIKGADLVDEVIDQTKLEVTDDVVHGSVTLSDETAEVVAFMVPVINNARVSTRRNQSMNNLKMIGLAMHNYHDTYRHFPPAVVMGPDGKTPHSWRVEILPFLDQAPLYKEYRMNEPWDSEHNKKLLEKIPDVFRSPMDDSLSTDTSYFTLTGRNTIFDKNVKRGDEVGVGFRDITDGASNTMMVVESKQAVPWTKPDDIPIDFDKDLPEIGGWYDDGFIGLICDGSVRFMLSTTEEKILKLLFQRNDGQPIPR